MTGLATGDSAGDPPGGPDVRVRGLRRVFKGRRFGGGVEECAGLEGMGPWSYGSVERKVNQDKG